MRGRPGSRKGPNPLTRSYESSGPDVKIRGTAQHIGEKYLQLARDAQASGDPVMAENYLQHAEHYFRIIAAAQQAQQQGGAAYQGLAGDTQAEEAEEDLGFGGIPDRFSSPLERPAAQPGSPQQFQGGSAQPAPERAFHGSAEKQGYVRSERGPRPDRPFHDRGYRDREYQPSPERPYQEQRPYVDRNGRGRDPESNGGQGRGPREYRGETSIVVDQRPETQMAADGAETAALPAFITAPVRIPAEPHDAAASAEARPALRTGPSDADLATGGYRPRRRRSPKLEPETAAVSGGEGSANDPAQD
jgi:hypothetical protein